METGAFPCVTSHTLLVNQEEKCVLVAVESNGTDPLSISRTLAFDPNLISAPAEVGTPGSLQGEPQSFAIEISEHQNFFALLVLNDDWQ